MAERSARGERVSSIDLRQLNRVLELSPEDMTVTVESGLTLGALQGVLARHGQWLPVDPPHAHIVSVHEVLSQNLSGPRRFGHGTIREHLLGMKVVLADGRIIKSGGKVVKNVAGYDLARLFIGARNSLGIIVEATFKLHPLPQLERFVGVKVPPCNVARMLRSVADSPLTPVVLDACYFNSNTPAPAPLTTLILGFAGSPDEVNWQLKEARGLGFESDATLDHETAFWENASHPVHRLSVLPSHLSEALTDLGSSTFVARAGNGIVYYHGEPLRTAREPMPYELMRRVKQAYDPKNILPEFAV